MKFQREGERFMRWVLFLSLCVGIGWGAASFASHGHWIDHYRSAANSLCCGERDCQPASIRILVFGPEMVTAEINGVIVEVPARSVHQSEDQRAYWCANMVMSPPSTANVRCLFWAIGA